MVCKSNVKKLWHTEGKPQGPLLDVLVSELLPVKQHKGIWGGKQGGKESERGRERVQREREKAVRCYMLLSQAWPSVHKQILLCHAGNFFSMICKVFLIKLVSQKSLTWYVLQQVLRTPVNRMWKDGCNVIHTH